MNTLLAELFPLPLRACLTYHMAALSGYRCDGRIREKLWHHDVLWSFFYPVRTGSVEGCLPFFSAQQCQLGTESGRTDTVPRTAIRTSKLVL